MNINTMSSFVHDKQLIVINQPTLINPVQKQNELLYTNLTLELIICLYIRADIGSELEIGLE